MNLSKVDTEVIVSGCGQSRAVAVLERLLWCTEQLARLEETPDAEVESLTRECAENLKILDKMMPDGAGAPEAGQAGDVPGESLKMLLTRLNLETQRCIQALEQGRSRIANEMASLRKRQRAISAYQGNL